MRMFVPRHATMDQKVKEQEKSPVAMVKSFATLPPPKKKKQNSDKEAELQLLFSHYFTLID